MRKVLIAMLLIGLTAPAQALDLPGFGRKKDESAAKDDDAPSEQGIGSEKAPASGAGEKGKVEAFPVRVTNEDINGANPKFLETYFVALSFMQKMQLPDGSMTTEPGRVLVFQKGDAYVISFYRPMDGAYTLMGQPVVLKNAGVPREDFHLTHNVPTVVCKRTDTAGIWRVYVLAGKTVSEAAPDDTVLSPASLPALTPPAATAPAAAAPASAPAAAPAK